MDLAGSTAIVTGAAAGAVALEEVAEAVVACIRNGLAGQVMVL